MSNKNEFRVLRTQPVSSGLGTWAIPNALKQIRQMGAKVFVGDDETENGVIDAITRYSPINIILTTYGIRLTTYEFLLYTVYALLTTCYLLLTDY